MYTTSIINIVTHRQLHCGYTAFLFTCSASAASPPRLTDTGARSVTNTILTRWDTNSWRKKQTDGNMSAPLLSWILVTLTGVRGRSIQEEKGGPEGREASHFCVFHAEHSGMDMHLKLQLMINEVALCCLYGVHSRVFWQLHLDHHGVLLQGVRQN